MTLTERSTAPTGPTSAEQLQHIACCVNDNVALCSTDVSAEPCRDVDATCVVCADLECTEYCPIRPRCICVEDEP